jgi:hypothetical protein
MRVFNKKYWPHQIRLRTVENNELSHHNVEKMERFCYDNFKSREWNNHNRYFVFKREEDLTFFMLRWG